MIVDLLRDVLPIDARLNPKTERSHLHRVAERLESELGDERPNFIDSCPRDWKALPLPEGEIVAGVDGGMCATGPTGKIVSGLASRCRATAKTVILASCKASIPSRDAGCGNTCVHKACS